MGRSFENPVERFFHPVLAARALKSRPARATVDGENFVLFRGRAGRVFAFADRCAHRNAPLSRGRVDARGRLVCPYHGWAFTEDGVAHSPSEPERNCALRSYRVEERFGYLWLGGADAAFSEPPGDDWEGFSLGGAITLSVAAPFALVFDNVSEDEHVPFVHTRLGWSARGIDNLEFECQSKDEETLVSYRAPQRLALVGLALGILPGDQFRNDWITRYDPVRTLFRLTWASRRGGLRPVETRALLHLVPQTAKTTLAVMFMFVRARPRWMRRFHRPIGRLAVWVGRRELLDDKRFVETMADAPTDLRDMKPGRFDRPLVHNRRLLREIYRAGAPERSEAPVE